MFGEIGPKLALIANWFSRINGHATISLPSLTLTLEESGVTPGSYTSTNLTVDAYGRIVSAADGSGGGGGGGSPGGSSGQVQYNDGGSAFGGFTVGGDGTLNTSTGSLTVTKTNGTSFAASATTDTTNASNISSGTLSGSLMEEFGSSNAGAVPASGGGTSNFLRADGTWDAPSGGGGSGTVNSGTSGQMTYYASTGTAVSGDANATISSGSLTLGQSGTAGRVVLNGSSSGTVTISTYSSAGSGTNFVLPNNNGTNNYVLQTDGSGNTSWVAPSGGGGGSGTVNSGTAGQVAYYASTTNAVSGDANVTISGGSLTLGQSGTAGTIVLNGATSGTVTLETPSVAGSGTIVTFPSSNSNTVQPLSSATSHEWVQYIDSGGTQHLTQPSFSDISGTAAMTQGGTGSSLSTNNAVIITNSTTTMTSLTGTNGGVYFNSSSTPTAGLLPYNVMAPNTNYYTYCGGV